MIKSVTLDPDIFDYICDTVDGKDDERKSFSAAVNYLIKSQIALKKELKNLKEELIVKNDKEPAGI